MRRINDMKTGFALWQRNKPLSSLIDVKTQCALVYLSVEVFI